MNPLLLPTILLAGVLYGLGLMVGRRVVGKVFALICLGAVVIALPGVVFAVHYLRVLGEPIWLYEFRSAPFSELAASAAGFLAGLLQGKVAGHERALRIVGR